MALIDLIFAGIRGFDDCNISLSAFKLSTFVLTVTVYHVYFLGPQSCSRRVLFRIVRL